MSYPSIEPVVLVTGAAKRLGREIALTLAKHGWRVAVHYRSSEQDAINTIADLAINTPATGENGIKIAYHAKFQCDLSDETAVRALLPDRKSTRLNSSHRNTSRMPSSA